MAAPAAARDTRADAHSHGPARRAPSFSSHDRRSRPRRHPPRRPLPRRQRLQDVRRDDDPAARGRGPALARRPRRPLRPRHAAGRAAHACSTTRAGSTTTPRTRARSKAGRSSTGSRAARRDLARAPAIRARRRVPLLEHELRAARARRRAGDRPAARARARAPHHPAAAPARDQLRRGPRVRGVVRGSRTAPTSPCRTRAGPAPPARSSPAHATSPASTARSTACSARSSSRR